MNFETIILETNMGVATIKLNRPEVLNALNRQMFLELAQAADMVEADNEVRVLVITGGEKCFAAGADIRPLAQATPEEMVISETVSNRAYDKIEALPIPVIAAVSGLALGGGCELALVCDLRIASDTAMFGQPEVNLGIIPGLGGTQRLPRLIGVGRAKEMIYTGKTINAGTALEYGLVSKVVPADELMAEVQKIAASLSKKSPVTLRVAKKTIDEGISMDLARACEYERLNFAYLFATEDQKEGMAAFLEKRKPQFQGK